MLKIDHDFHIHTVLSACCSDANQTVENISRVARELGLKKIGFSDHTWENPMLVPSAWYQPQGGSRIIELAHEAKRYADDDLEILVGCEVETIAPGKFSISEKFAADLDYVMLATDHFHMKDLVLQPANYTPQVFADHMIEMLQAGIRCPFVDILAHVFMPMGHYKLYGEIADTVSDARFIEVFSEAAEKNLAIEITLSFLPDPVRGKEFSIEIPLRVLSLAKSAGCKFVFSSDSHAIEKFKHIKDLSFFVEKLNLKAEDIHSLGK
jgi:HisJ family histidinol phosphate phosphatase